MTSIYTVREFGSNAKAVKEYIFVGNLLDSKDLRDLRNNVVTPKDIDLLKKYDVQSNSSISQIYITDYLINSYDSWSIVYQKVRQAMGQDTLYFWSQDELVTHRYLDQNGKDIQIEGSPFLTPKDSKVLENIRDLGTKKILVDQSDYLLRNTMVAGADGKVIQVISGSEYNQWLENRAPFRQSDELRDVCYTVYFPSKLSKKWKGLTTEIKRKNDLELNRVFFQQKYDFGKDYIKNFDYDKGGIGQIKRCKILVNQDMMEQSLYNKNAAFVDLNAIFNLYSLAEGAGDKDKFDDVIFMKIRKDDKAISKIIKEPLLVKSMGFNQTTLEKMSDPEDIPKGLLVVKNKMVKYELNEFGVVFLHINFTEDGTTIRSKKALDNNEAMGEIQKELKSLNAFLTKVNKIDYQLSGHGNEKIGLADLDLGKGKGTRFLEIDSETLFSTDRKVINLGHFNYMVNCFRNFVMPLGNWKIYNEREIQPVEFKDIDRAYFHYILTDNNVNPTYLDRFNGPIYYLGLLGDLRIIVNVTKAKKTDLILGHQELFGYKRNEVDRDEFESHLQKLESGSGISGNIAGVGLSGIGSIDFNVAGRLAGGRAGDGRAGDSRAGGVMGIGGVEGDMFNLGGFRSGLPGLGFGASVRAGGVGGDIGAGIMFDLAISRDGYLLNIHKARSLQEIIDINRMMALCINFYFHLKKVGRLKESIINCSTIGDNVLKVNRKEEVQVEDVLPYMDDDDDDNQMGLVDFSRLDEMTDMDTSSFYMPVEEGEVMAETVAMEGERGIPSEGDDGMGGVLPFDDLDIDEPIAKKDIKKPLAYLKEISPLFGNDYARHGCPGNHKPVVMSLNEYWKNYKKIKIKMKEFFDQLKKDDKKKFPISKEEGININSKNEKLDLLEKQAEFLKRKLSGTDGPATSAKKEEIEKDLTDLINIIQRYDRGLQIKIPLDDTRYTDFYFFLCPYNWCPACRESKVSSDIGTKGCQNCFSNVITNKARSYIWFPATKAAKHAHLKCLPCCYSKSPAKKSSDCIFEHPSRKVKTLDDGPGRKFTTNVDYVKTGISVPQGRFGFLDIDSNQGVLNDQFNDGLVFKTIKNNEPVYVRQGVKESRNPKDSFLQAIILYVKEFAENEEEEKEDVDIVEKFREHLIEKMTPDIFITINNGVMANIFSSENGKIDDALNSFHNYMRFEYLNEDFLWDFLSRPGILHEDGVNILFLERRPDGAKYNLICPSFAPFEEYYDDNKPIFLIYKISNNIYQPVTEIRQIPSFDDKPGLQTIFSNNVFYTSENPPIYFLVQELLKGCVEEKNAGLANRTVTYQKILELTGEKDEEGKGKGEKSSDYKITGLYFDPFYQVSYLVLKIGGGAVVNFPIRPIPMTTEMIQKGYTIYNILGDDKLTYEQTLKFLDKLGKDSGIRMDIKYLIRNEKDQIIGLMLESGLVMGFKPQKMTPKQIKEEKVGRFDVKIGVLPREVDGAILKENTEREKTQHELYVNRVLFQKEAYQRLRYVIGKEMLKKNKESVIKEIEKILASQVMPEEEKRNKLEKIMSGIVKDVSVVKKLSEKDLKDYLLPQVRTICNRNGGGAGKDTDPHCDNKGKVILPSIIQLPNNIEIDNSYDRNVTLLVEELLRNNVKRNELLKGKVSVYVSAEKQILRPDEEVVLEGDIPKTIEKFFARGRRDVTELYRKHYFLNKSEIFKREMKIYLFTLEEDWYKWMPESYVQNSRNIYTMLDNQLNTNIVEDFIDIFFDTEDSWKKWLSQLKDEAPRDYDSVNTRGQFMEKIRYGKPPLSNIHYNILSKKHKTHFIIMDKNQAKNFFCLGFTMTLNDQYMLIYRDGEDDYLVGQTPHSDLALEEGVVYQFNSENMPTKLLEAYRVSCGAVDLKRKADSINDLLTVQKVDNDIVDEASVSPDLILEEDLVFPDDRSLMEKMLVDEDMDIDDKKMIKKEEDGKEEKAKQEEGKPKPKPKITLKKTATPKKKPATPKKPKITLKKKPTTPKKKTTTPKKKPATPKKPKITFKKKTPKKKTPNKPKITLKKK